MILAILQKLWDAVLRDALTSWVAGTDNKYDDSIVRFLDILLNDAE